MNILFKFAMAVALLFVVNMNADAQFGKLKGIAGFVDFSKFHKKYSVETLKIKSKDVVETQEQTEKAAENKEVKPAEKPATKPVAADKQPAAAKQNTAAKSTSTAKPTPKK